MKEFNLSTNQLKEHIDELSAGDKVLLSGIIYTSRDAAHKKIVNLIMENQPLPFNIKGATIYYAGPTPAKDYDIIGSCGPTTSSRMDPYSPLLLDKGLICMIGKGPRSKEVIDAIKRNNAIYLCAIGGAGALASQSIKKCEVIAFQELGCESVKKLEIKDFPLIVGIDNKGESIFEKNN